jgi:hypothetical protein
VQVVPPAGIVHAAVVSAAVPFALRIAKVNVVDGLVGAAFWIFTVNLLMVSAGPSTLPLSADPFELLAIPNPLIPLMNRGIVLLVTLLEPTMAGVPLGP